MSTLLTRPRASLPSARWLSNTHGVSLRNATHSAGLAMKRLASVWMMASSRASLLTSPAPPPSPSSPSSAADAPPSAARSAFAAAMAAACLRSRGAKWSST